MLTQFERQITSKCQQIMDDTQQINDLIAEQYDSEPPHATQFSATDKNRIKLKVLHPDNIRKLAIDALQQAGLIPLAG